LGNPINPELPSGNNNPRENAATPRPDQSQGGWSNLKA